MKRSFLRIFSICVFVLLAGQSCSLFGDSEKALLPDGGLFVSEDSGATFQQRVLIPTVTGQPGSISTVDVRTMKIDPSDRKAIYLGTGANGLIYSYDQGRTWRQPTDIRAGNVNSISIDTSDKCVYYVAIQNVILKTTDCSRTFKQAYVDSRQNVVMKYVEVDPRNPRVIYAGTSSGDLLASSDMGGKWKTIQRFNIPISQILVYPEDSNVIFVGLENNGLRKSADKGETWIDITPDIKQYAKANIFGKLVWHDASDDFFLSTGYGIFRTEKGGDSWEALRLITAPGEVNIYGLAINPSNVSRIVYSTATPQSSTLYFTQDGGKTWTIQKSPTTRAISNILFDPEATQIMYMSGVAIKG